MSTKVVLAVELHPHQTLASAFIKELVYKLVRCLARTWVHGLGLYPYYDSDHALSEANSSDMTRPTSTRTPTI